MISLCTTSPSLTTFHSNTPTLESFTWWSLSSLSVDSLRIYISLSKRWVCCTESSYISPSRRSCLCTGIFFYPYVGYNYNIGLSCVVAQPSQHSWTRWNTKRFRFVNPLSLTNAPFFLYHKVNCITLWLNVEHTGGSGDTFEHFRDGLKKIRKKHGIDRTLDNLLSFV